MNDFYEHFSDLHNRAADEIQSKNLGRLDGVMLRDLIRLRAEVNVYQMITSMAAVCDGRDLESWLIDQLVVSAAYTGGKGNPTLDQIERWEVSTLAKALQTVRMQLRSNEV